jgi:beta-glucosidase
MTDWFGGMDPVAQMKAGNELLMPGTGRQQEALMAALESGALSEEVLDRNLEWILDVIQRSPAFEGKPPRTPPT